MPVYHITINPAYIESLDVDIWSSRTFPADLEYESKVYTCQIRYRGSSSRALRKKSWKIYFNDKGPHSWKEVNLNAEFRDKSLCRNYLTMELSRISGIPTPETRFISLVINNQYFGVFLEIESVDSDFIERRDLGNGELFKALSHGARFAPPLHYEDLNEIYELKRDVIGANDTLGARLTFIQYADSAAFEERIGLIFNLPNILKYLAVQYVVKNGDGFTKNYYLYKCPDNRYIVIPWDCDGTFGNAAAGNFIDEANRKWIYAQYYHALFQRLIFQPERLNQWLSMIDDLLSTGFDLLSIRLDDVYREIRHDVYMDSNKLCNNEEFELEYNRISDFMNDRNYYLNDINWFQRIEILESKLSHDYINNPSDSVHIEVKVIKPIYQTKIIIYDVYGHKFEFQLWDDGTHSDILNRDNIYSGNLVFPEEMIPPYYYCFFVKPNTGGICPTPPSGGWNFKYYTLSLPVIQVIEQPSQKGEIEISTIWKSEREGIFSIALVNRSERNVNVSGCVIRIGHDHRLLRLRELPPISSKDTLFVTNNAKWLSINIPSNNVTGNLFFEPFPDDSIFLETSSGHPLSFRHYTPIEYVDNDIVINEINYKSPVSFDCEDWIEITCRRGTYDLSNWLVKDNNDDHVFSIPEGTFLGPDQYLVIARDITKFTRIFPNINLVVGDFDFGFDSNGDGVRLFDNNGALIDDMTYYNLAGWPKEAEDGASTLELTNPNLHNYGPQNWMASLDNYPNGTPGHRNSVYFRPSNIRDAVPYNWGIEMIYPNPANDRVTIRWSQDVAGSTFIRVLDLQGRVVNTIEQLYSQPGTYFSNWNTFYLSNGTYLLRFENNNRFQFRKAIILK
ncbi:MAG: CotH kinase family protein [Candidatus Hatepunaea meridiana]|nr:CotH kinase family protein [Candidatus Hatepunaea meridiana]